MTDVRNHAVSVVERTRKVDAGAPIIAAYVIDRAAFLVLGGQLGDCTFSCHRC